MLQRLPLSESARQDKHQYQVSQCTTQAQQTGPGSLDRTRSSERTRTVHADLGPAQQVKPSRWSRPNHLDTGPDLPSLLELTCWTGPYQTRWIRPYQTRWIKPCQTRWTGPYQARWIIPYQTHWSGLDQARWSAPDPPAGLPGSPLHQPASSRSGVSCVRCYRAEAPGQS